MIDPFSDAKGHGEIRTGSPPKIGHFRRKTRYNSKTVQDRRIVSIKVEYRKSYALYQMAMFPMTLGDP